MHGAERVEHWPVERLMPYARNARLHSEEQVGQIAASIGRFGFNNPVLVDEAGMIIAGHGRVLAARRLGLETVPVVPLAHMEPKEKEAYILADNRLAENATWDEALLGEVLADLDQHDIDVASLGFGEKELAKLMSEPDPEDIDPGKVDDVDDAPAVPAEPVSMLGDCWVLGAHRLVCGDSTEERSFESLLGGEQANLVVTDPPYGVAFERGKYVGRDKAAKGPDLGPIANDHLKGDALTGFVKAALGHAAAAAADGAPCYVWAPSMAEGYAILQGVMAAGFKVQSQIIWRKTPFVIGRADYHWQHEVCWYGWKEGNRGGHPWFGARDQSTVWDFPKPRVCDLHPTMKPPRLIEKALRNSSRRGDVVLDPFGGSGTTLIAAERMGRVARLIELDPRYIDVIIRRWQGQTKRQAVLEATGRSFAEVERERRAAA